MTRLLHDSDVGQDCCSLGIVSFQSFLGGVIAIFYNNIISGIINLSYKYKYIHWARHLTLTVSLSTQVYKWVPANLMLGVILRWTSIPSRGGVQILQVASCYRNRDRLWRDGPLGSICRLKPLLTSFYRLNINPYEVENCLKEHPAVLDCAVVSSPYMMSQVNPTNRHSLCVILIRANAVKTEKGKSKNDLKHGKLLARKTEKTWFFTFNVKAKGSKTNVRHNLFEV